jgi:hypothetical protein
MYRHLSWKGRLLRSMLARRGAGVVQMIGAAARGDLALVHDTERRVPLLVQEAAALQILACVRACAHLGGSMAEAGVFAGGTARLICEAKGSSPLRLFDVFETLQGPPDPTKASQRANELRGHFRFVHASRAGVERLLAPYPGVHLHPGVFPETAAGLEGERFSFVHLDLDLEPSTRDALRFFHPRLLPGGILVGDDYDAPGVRRAFDEHFDGRADVRIELPWSQVVVVKAEPRSTP